MARQYGHQKIDLRRVLERLEVAEPVRYGELITEIRMTFMCSDRGAKDALAVLRRGRFVTVLRAGARVEYRVSPRGHYLLDHPQGSLVLRYARKLFTTCPSPKTLRLQAATREQYGSVDEALTAMERLILKPSDDRTSPGVALAP